MRFVYERVNYNGWIFEDCDNALGLFRKLKRLEVIEINQIK